MKQYHYARKERQLKLITKKLQHLLSYQGEEPSSQIEKLILKIKKLVQELMHVLSPTKLKRILGTAAICLGISFTNQISAQSFAPPQVNPYGLDSTSYFAFPAFADLDGDGDMDLLVGEYYGAMQYFENTGTANNPQFAAPQVNPFGLVSTNYLAFPAFADLDGDGDMDLLVGEDYGAMQYFENTSILTGITNLSQSLDLKLFPNPVKDILRIESEEKVERIEVFNVLGQTAVIVENTTDKVSLNNLSPGIYTVKVTDVKGNYTVRKIQKQ